ncbi:hypothetical protein EC973_004207 [Apophysomyces ossiformis]|uniref:Uncharacterized protein n=1 Tax=Apophysomyces ossiformis TaxID=679940 RepID=A0A8H7ERZ4_9FUNG|nr:hypothetical protein EC973_004207 [Apophysomyces ossiformis]
MGLLKLGSLYNKKKSKEKQQNSPSTPPPVPVPTSPPLKLEPLTLDLNFELNEPQANKQPVVTTQIAPKSAPATRPLESGSLFDDIFSELKAKPLGTQDEFHSDLSLAVALSQQLQLDAPTTTKVTNATSAQKPTRNQPTPKSDFLINDDSIYSSYLRNLRSLEQDNDSGPAQNTITATSPTTTTTTAATTSFGTSMFAALMQQQQATSATSTLFASTTPTKTNPTPAKPTPAVTTPVVLDSDVSDSDDANDSDSGEEEEVNPQGVRMTKGARPIMERRTQDHRLMVKRKVDSWVNRVDPEANMVESNDSMIARMKDRHRQQVKMAVVRQQQQQQQQAMGMMPYPISPGFGLGPVPPHPAMINPAASPPHLYAAPQTLPPEFVDPSSTPLVYPLPNEAPAPAKPSVSRSSLPTSAGMSVESDTRSTTSTTTPPSSSSTSSSTSHKEPDSDEMEGKAEEDESHIDADDETSDDNASRGTKRSITRRRSKAKPKSRHEKLHREVKEEETEDDASQPIAPTTTHGEQVPKKGMRHSRSTPNLKKKKSSKKGSSNTSAANSRRNSQEDLVIPQRSTSTSSSPATMSRMKHMKSEPDMQQRRYPQPSLQQQQLQYEWNRMQAYQREQQLKHQYAHQFQSGSSSSLPSPPVHHHPYYTPQAMATGPTPHSDPHSYHRAYRQDPRASAMMYPFPSVSQSASTPTNNYPPHPSYYPVPQHTSYHYTHPSMR